MGEYIERETLKNAIYRTKTERFFNAGKTRIDFAVVRKAVLETPTADVAEVRHGEWKRKGQDIYCSVCGNESAYNPFGASKFSDYCPNCGADMRGGMNE